VRTVVKTILVSQRRRRGIFVAPKTKFISSPSGAAYSCWSSRFSVSTARTIPPCGIELQLFDDVTPTGLNFTRSNRPCLGSV
jgi:hypothetical protein